MDFKKFMKDNFWKSKQDKFWTVSCLPLIFLMWYIYRWAVLFLIAFIFILVYAQLSTAWAKYEHYKTKAFFKAKENEHNKRSRT